MARVTRQQWKAFAIVAIGWAAVLAYAWPGIMTIDCFDQLREGRAGFYTDGHPPIVAVMWRYLDKVVAGPAGMYVLQTTAFFAGLYAFFRRLYAAPRAAVTAVCVSLFPPILAPMGVVWKDALMASCLVLGLAGLFSKRRGAPVGGLAAMWFASAVRYNAAAATLAPIVLLFEWRAGQRWFVRYGIATAIWIAITASSMLVNKALTDRPMHFWTSSVAVHDIVGTLAKVDDDIPDDELRKVFAGTGLLVDKDIHQAIRAHYKRTDFTNLVIGDARLWDLPIMGDQPAPAEQRAAIDRAWSAVVSAHPGAYLVHRLDVFAAVLGLAKKSPGVQVQVGRGQNRLYAIPMGIDHRPYIAQNKVQHLIEKIAYWTPLFRAGLWLLVALVLVVLGRKKRGVLAVLGSGVLLELSLFPFAGSPDYRYSHWLVVCTVLAGVMLYRTRRVAAITKQASGSQARIQ